MADRKWQIGKVQVIWRPSSKLLKTLVIALIVFSTAALAALWWVRGKLLRQTEKMKNEAAAVQYQNEQLEEKLADMDSVQSILDIAKEEFGMVSQDTILIKPQS